MSKRRHTGPQVFPRPSTSKDATMQKGPPEVDPKVKKAAAQCVRMVLLKAGSQFAIRHADFKAIIPASVNLQKVIKETRADLKRIYGYDLNIHDSTKYFISNRQSGELIAEHEKKEKMIIFLVLTHIFMMQNNSPDTSLISFLQALDYCNEDDIGNVMDFVKGPMVKRKLVEIIKEEVTDKTVIKWGPAADLTISKKDILDFVSKCYGKSSNSFPKQFEEAERNTKMNTSI